MKIQKVFEISSKKIQQKPRYVKPKYKTYRQLLQLDKPKMIVHNDSDDEDDFLQKLMRQEEKLQQQLKQKKKMKQKKLSSAVSKSKRKDSSTKQKTDSQSVKKSQPVEKMDDWILLQCSQRKNDLLQSAIDKQENNHLTKIDENNQSLIASKIKNDQKQNCSNKRNTPDKTLQPVITTQELKDKTNLKKFNNTIVVRKRKRSSSTMNLWQDLELNSLKKSNSYKKRNQLFNKGRMTMPNVVKLLSEGNGNGEIQIVKNQFVCSITGRKSQGYKILREQVSGRKSLNSVNQNKILIQSKLNPQLKQVHHQFSTQKKQQPSNKLNYSKPTEFLLRSASSPCIQQLLMNKMVRSFSPQKKCKLKQKLFKSKYQQELFLESLRLK